MAVLKGTNIKDQLVAQISEELKQPENVVDKVVSHQFKHANQAMKIYSQIEISGFGKFEISAAKVKRRIANKEEIRDVISQKTPEEMLTNNYQKKLSGVLNDLEYYYKRLK